MPRRRKLTDDTLAALVHDYVTDPTVTQRALASKYGITQAHVSNTLAALAETDAALAAARSSPRGRPRPDPAVVAADYAAGATQQALAVQYGVSQSRISRLLKVGAVGAVTTTKNVKEEAQLLDGNA